MGKITELSIEELENTMKGRGIAVVVRETEKAILIRAYDNAKKPLEVWVPKSQVEVTENTSGVKLVSLADWIARKKNLKNKEYVIVDEDDVEKVFNVVEAIKKKKSVKSRAVAPKYSKDGKRIYRLLAKGFVLEPGRAEEFYKKKKFPVWLVIDPEAIAWDEKKGRLVGLNPKNIRGVERLGIDEFVVEYETTTNLFDGFVQTGEEGEELDEWKVYGTDVGDIVEEIAIRRTNDGWELDYKRYKEA